MPSFAPRVWEFLSFGPSFSGIDAEQLLEDVRNWTQEECYRLRKEIDG